MRRYRKVSVNVFWVLMLFTYKSYYFVYSSCEKVCRVASVAKPTNSDQFDRVDQNLKAKAKELLTQLDGLTCLSETDIDLLCKKACGDIPLSINTFRENLNKQLDVIERKTLEKSVRKCVEVELGLQNTMEECLELKEKLIKLAKNDERKHDPCDVECAFILYKQNKALASEVKRLEKSAENQCSIIKFKEDVVLRSNMKLKTSLGATEVFQRIDQSQNKQKVAPIGPMQADKNRGRDKEEFP